MNKSGMKIMKKTQGIGQLHLVCLTLLWVVLIQTQNANAQISESLNKGMVPNSLNQDMEAIDNYYDKVRAQLSAREKKAQSQAAMNEGIPDTPILPNISNDEFIPGLENKELNSAVTPSEMTEVLIGDSPLADGNQGFEFQKNPAVLQSEPSNRAGYRNGKRNPFETTSRLLQVRKDDKTGLQFQPARTKSKMPKMKLRGIIHREGKKQAALLEIEGAGIHVVREDDTVGLNEIGRDSVIRIKKINRLNLVVEVGSLGQVWIVR